MGPDEDETSLELLGKIEAQRTLAANKLVSLRETLAKDRRAGTIVQTFGLGKFGQPITGQNEPRCSLDWAIWRVSPDHESTAENRFQSEKCCQCPGQLRC